MTDLRNSTIYSTYPANQVMKRELTIIGILMVILSLSGCGPKLDSEGYFQLQGEASWDGAPISEGLIVFRTSEDDKRNVAAPITAGKYEIKIQPGPKTVEITAKREVPGKFAVGADGEQIPATESYIPARFNTETELKADIAFPETKKLDFDLKDS